MSCGNSFIKLCKYGIPVGVGAALSLNMMEGSEQKSYLPSKISILAKGKESDILSVNNLYHGTDLKWDSNWDYR